MTKRHPVRKAQVRGAKAGQPQGADGKVLRDALMEAVRQHQAGQLDAAAMGYARILGLDPNHADALHLSGLIAHQRGDNARAVDLINKAIKRSPRDAAYRSNLGAALLAMDRAAEAADAFRRALALDPAHADAHNNLGNVMMREGRPADAEGCYRRALAARPGHAVAWNNLGGALRAQGRLDAAAEAYREALALAPEYAGALSNLGRVLHEQARYDEALPTGRRCSCCLAASRTAGRNTNGAGGSRTSIRPRAISASRCGMDRTLPAGAFSFTPSRVSARRSSSSATFLWLPRAAAGLFLLPTAVM